MKRTNGEGSVRKLPSGRWQARLAVTMEDGTMVRPPGTYPTKTAALAALRELKRQADMGRPITVTDATVRAWFDHWEAEVLPASVPAVSTADQYRSLIRTHALPVLGSKRLPAVRPSLVEKLVHGLDRSPSTRRSLYAALRKMFAAAERDGLIPRNPVAQVSRPTLPRAVPRAPALDDVRKLLDQANGTRWEHFALLVATTGGRRGEVLAIRWEDVVQDARGQHFVQLGEALVRASDGLKRRDPKTSAGWRRVPLPAIAVAALKAQRRMQAEDRLRHGPEWIESGYVFTTPLGGAIEPRNASRAWAKLAEDAGVADPGMHALRHYVATVLLSTGSSAREVADQLGHSSPVVTLELYAATIPESQRAAVERVAGMLG